MLYKTIREATLAWVHEFNAIETGMIKELMNNRPWDWRECDEPSGYHEQMPMWGTMWSFSDSTDKYWLEELNGLQSMTELGFRVYESNDYGYFFGIDGAGFDFYEAYWIPLYQKRGLHWHE